MQIKSTKDITVTEKFRFMLYGLSGVGKTKLIGTIPEKTLIMNADKGMLTLASMDKDFVSVNSWKEIEEVLTYLKSKEALEKYQWFCIDSGTAVADLLLNHLSEEKKLSGFDLWREYGNIYNKFMRFLRDQQAYHTLSIFEAIDKEDESGIMTKSFGVQGSIGGRIPNFYDFVFALKVDKTGNRIIQTSSTPGWICKDRSQKLEKQEPADLGQIMKKIRGDKV
jgi:hypothetical protein